MSYYYNYAILVLGIVVFFISGQTQGAPKLACYYLSWPRYYAKPMTYLPQDIPAELCDELVYFHVELNETTFDIDYSDHYAQVELGDIDNITKLRGQIYKVIIAIGGYEKSLKGFSALASPENRRTFIENVIKFMNKHNFNGVLIDWTYPGGADTTDKTTYVQLVKDLRVEMKKLRFKLAITGPHSRYFLPGYDVAELSKHVDSIYVKTYDMWGYWEKTAYPHNPLYQVSSNTERAFSVQSSMSMWNKTLGAPKNKLYVGISLFGQSLKLSQGATNGDYGAPLDEMNPKGEKERYSQVEGEITYYELCSKLMSGGSWVNKWDNESLVSYAYDLAGERKWVSYENPKSAFEKAKFVAREGYGGVFGYGISIDDFRGLCGLKHSITKAIRSGLRN